MTAAEARAVLLAAQHQPEIATAIVTVLNERLSLIAELRRQKRDGATHIAIAEVLELLGERS